MRLGSFFAKPSKAQRRQKNKGEVVAVLLMWAMAVSLAQDAAAQIITTYAGPAAPVNGLPATNYAIGVPHSVRLDGANGYFVLTDYRIYHVSSDGGLQLVAGETDVAGFTGDGGPATSAQLAARGFARDKSSNLIIADGVNNRIRLVTPDGTITTIAGTGIADFAETEAQRRRRN